MSHMDEGVEAGIGEHLQAVLPPRWLLEGSGNVWVISAHREGHWARDMWRMVMQVGREPMTLRHTCDSRRIQEYTLRSVDAGGRTFEVLFRFIG